MKKTRVGIFLMMFILFCVETKAQSLSTTVERLEVDGKEVSRNYKVFLYSRGRRFKAKRIKNGFVVPDEILNEQNVDARIIFGKYILDFSKIPLSVFSEVWRIGVDKKPFESVSLTSEEAKKIKLIYYVQFEVGQLVVKIGLP